MKMFNIIRRGITNPLWFISGVIMRCPQLVKDDKQYLKYKTRSARVKQSTESQRFGALLCCIINVKIKFFRFLSR